MKMEPEEQKRQEIIDDVSKRLKEMSQEKIDIIIKDIVVDMIESEGTNLDDLVERSSKLQSLRRYRILDLYDLLYNDDGESHHASYVSDGHLRTAIEYVDHDIEKLLMGKIIELEQSAIQGFKKYAEQAYKDGHMDPQKAAALGIIPAEIAQELNNIDRAENIEQEYGHMTK